MSGDNLGTATGPPACPSLCDGGCPSATGSPWLCSTVGCWEERFACSPKMLQVHKQEKVSKSMSFLSGQCHCEQWINMTRFHCILLKKIPVRLRWVLGTWPFFKYLSMLGKIFLFCPFFPPICPWICHKTPRLRHNYRTEFQHIHLKYEKCSLSLTNEETADEK